MTVPFWCVLIAGLMPFAAAFIAKCRPDFDNANPRAWLARQQGFRARAHAAQLNCFEAFPFFAAAVLIAHLRGATVRSVELLALGFIAARVLYIALYIANLARLRTCVWFIATGCTVAMFFLN